MVTFDGYPVDVAVTEEHAFDAEVTDHPVEKGADVTDHTRLKPPTVTIEGVVSDSPIGAVALDPSRTGSTKPSDDALAKILKIRDDRLPITITTALRRYENMGLQTLSIPKSKDIGAALRFRATFKQLTFVTNKRTTVKTVVPRSKGKAKRGTKPSPTVDPSAFKSPLGVEKDSSFLEKGKRFVGGLF